MIDTNNSPITSQPKSSDIKELSITNSPSPEKDSIRPYNCPPGLEYLLRIDQLLVQQKIEMFETLTGFQTPNEYLVTNTMGQQVFVVKEEPNIRALMCFGPNRPFEIRVLDNFNREVIHISRPFRCRSCCSPCCLQYIEVEAPPGNTIGFVKQDFSCCYPKFSVRNASDDRMLRIDGPFLTYSILFNEIEFIVHSTQEYKVEVGKITKQWSGLLREGFTNADNFSVAFPMDLEVNVKACLFAAVFLIDYMYFENKIQNNRRSSSRLGIHRHNGIHDSL